MSDGEWTRVKELFVAALARPPEEREAWLRRACDGGSALYTEVASLLSEHVDDRFLTPPEAIDSSTMDAALDRDLSLGSGGGSRLGALPDPGATLAGRYELRAPIGAGAAGAVFRARDRISGDEVAVKVLRRGLGRASPEFRSELATLRRARLPGIVEILDDGIDGEHVYIVLALVVGTAFPGGRGPDWDGLAETALALAESLERLHWAGIVHRDLKPDNVLVDAAGCPTITDLGIAWEPAWRSPSAEPVAGTPNYMAPELFRGGAPDVRTDLYALGAMLFQALSGRRPHRATHLLDLIEERCSRSAPPIASLAPSVPPHVARVVDALLARDPGGRPQSAGEVARALRGEAVGRDPEEAPLSGLALRDGAFTRRALTALFAGPERVHHLPSDAARALHAATGGRPQDVRATLARWRRAGLVRLDAQRYVVTRSAIERLRTDSAAPGPAETPAALLEAARRAFALGHVGRAVALGERAASLWHATPGAGADAAAELVALFVECALVEGSRQGFDRAEYQALRLPAIGGRLEDLARIRAAVLAVARGDPASAFARLEAPFAHTGTEDLRRKVRAHVGRTLGGAAHVSALRELACAARAGESPASRAMFLTERGWSAYRAGDFDLAARRHLHATRHAQTSPAVTASLGAAASALLDAGRHERARSTARRAARLARRLRLPHLEARALWIARSADYRRGRAGAQDGPLLEAVRHLGLPYIQGLVGLTEAAAAWRSGASAAALALAGEAEHACARAGMHWPRAVVAAFAGRLRGSWDQECVERACELLADCRAPGLGLQLAALQAPALPRDLVRAAAGLAQRIPLDRWSRRLEILTPGECLALMRGHRFEPMSTSAPTVRTPEGTAMTHPQGAPPGRTSTQLGAAARWFDVTQDDPTQVVAQVEYRAGATPLEWTLVWYIFAGFDRASPSHPHTRFTFDEAPAPAEPPPCEYIDTHSVTDLPAPGGGSGGGGGGGGGEVVIQEIDPGWFALRSTGTSPELWGQVHVEPGPSPDETVETWYVSAAYQPLGGSTLHLSEDLDDLPSGPGPFAPDRVLHHAVVRSLPTV